MHAEIRFQCDRCNPTRGLSGSPTPGSRTQSIGLGIDGSFLEALPLFFLSLLIFRALQRIRRIRKSGGEPSPAAIVKWLIDLTRAPEMMQQHGEFARHGDDRSFLGVLTAAGGDG